MHRRPQRASRRRGAIVVLTAFMLLIFMIFAAFSVDVGHLMLARTRAQVAADAAALAGADELGNGVDTIEATVEEFLALNGFDTTTSIAIETTTKIGFWDDEIASFNEVEEESQANAVKVTLTHSGVNSYFGTFLGAEKYTVPAGAIATRGQIPRDIILVIDCSTSMGSRMGNGEKRIDNAKTAAQALVAQLGEIDRVGLAVFSWRDPERNHYDRTGVVEELLDFDKDPTNTRIGELKKGEYISGTNIGGGLRAGLDAFLYSDPRPPIDGDVERILVLLTDGRVNKGEPYPYPDDGPTGVCPPPPYEQIYDNREAVTQWSNTIKAREIKLHVITLGDNAYDELMVDAASPNEDGKTYYHHVADGDNDYQVLLDLYRAIGRGNRFPQLVK